jgi:phage host-nuclease inhibitor protein Gam
MASPKIEKISEPAVKLNDRDELNTTLRKLITLQRKLDRSEDTLDRRKTAATKKHEEAAKPILAEINPLLDQVFWYVYIHWNDLITGKATESVKLNEAEFKRHIDKVGTLIYDLEVTAKYLLNIEKSDFALKLRQEIGEEAARALLKRLKSFVSVKVVNELDTSKLKKFLTEPEAVEIEGATMQYTNRLTMSPNQSPSQKERGRKPTTTARQIPS